MDEMHKKDDFWSIVLITILLSPLALYCWIVDKIQNR